MTNKEKYKKAFSTLRASDDLTLEVSKMEKISRKHRINRMIAVVAVCTLLIGAGVSAYSADLGGIQRTIQLWIHGEQTAASIQFDGNGHYSMTYTDSEGNQKRQSGGGVSSGVDGKEKPVSQEALMEQLTAPEVKYEQDGKIFVYWFEQKIEITDKFKDHVCYVKLIRGDKTLYMTVKYQNGYSLSPHKFPSPNLFN